ncbi:MAG: IS3 family transposase [Streptosporangiales bacterium]
MLDIALVESFDGMLKVERVYRTVYPTSKQAEECIGRYIEMFCNCRRIRSRLGHRTLHEVRTEYLNGSSRHE